MSDSGGTRIDLHVKVLNETVIRRAKTVGLDAIVYAPHFRRLPEIEARADRYSDSELTIIPAREVFTGSWAARKHVLALDLDDPIPDFITLEGAMTELARQEAVILIPHPGYLTISLSPADVKTYASDIDGIETYNPKYLPWHHRRAERIRSAVDKPAFGSSYAHLNRTVGEVWTKFSDIPPTTEAILDALRGGSSRDVLGPRGVGHQLARGIELGHLVYENTWQKLARFVSRDIPSTHPANPAYNGQFDGVRIDL